MKFFNSAITLISSLIVSVILTLLKLNDVISLSGLLLVSLTIFSISFFVCSVSFVGKKLGFDKTKD